MKRVISIQEALENALLFLESLGYREGGDIHDDLAAALAQVKRGPRIRLEREVSE